MKRSILIRLKRVIQMVKTSHLEPSLGGFSHPFLLYFAATRPAFLLATLAACCIGLAGAVYSGVKIQPLLAWVTIILALLVHAAVNVLNDYFDALNGTDEANDERIYPFTGGSRFIQNGVLTTQQTARLGYGLLLAAMLGGLWLAYQVDVGLLGIGAIGLLIGWAYSAAPLRLNSRGLGELCVLLGFLGIVVGTDYVMRKTFAFAPLAVGLPYALLVTNLLYINQFPDRNADALAGKHNLVVRLSSAFAVWGYFMIAIMAVVWLIAMVSIHQLPAVVIMATCPIILSFRAFVILRQMASIPSQLLPAIKLTLASMLSHALLLVIILIWKSA